MDNQIPVQYKIAALQAWNNFSEYYTNQIKELVKDYFILEVTYDQCSFCLNQYRAVWSFFPQFPKKHELLKDIDLTPKLIKTFWEYHEMGWDHGKVNVACSLSAYKILKESVSNALHVPLGFNKDHFFSQPFPESKVRVGWCGLADNPRKRFKELQKTLSTIPEIEFVYNIPPHVNDFSSGKYKSVAEMGNFYKDIHIYACASASEGFGLPLLEASACGRPVVTFNVGIAPELQKDGAGIIIVDSFQEMKKEITDLANNPDKIKKLGEQSAKVTLEKWQWSNFKERWLKVFRSI